VVDQSLRWSGISHRRRAGGHRQTLHGEARTFAATSDRQTRGWIVALLIFRSAEAVCLASRIHRRSSRQENHGRWTGDTGLAYRASSPARQKIKKTALTAEMLSGR
jgi:hypothetical protein